MRYFLGIYEDETRWAQLSPEETEVEMNGYEAFDKEVKAAGAYVAGEALHPTSAATTIRLRDDDALTTDGPFAETKEQLGGFYTVDCKDLDEAAKWAAKIPGARTGSVEVRPVVEFE